ncbi:MAG: cytochrome C oxidase subunit IV family protein, partial [Dehalococcoidia bacterium]
MAHQPEHTSNHPTFMQYVLIAIILFAITIVEFLLIWDKAGIVDSLGATKIPLLVGLSAVKFAIVIMFYMHLKFDNRLFGTVFMSGLVLAFIVGIAILTIFVGFGGGQRTFAEDRAVPYEEHAETGKIEEPTTPVPAGPLALA